MDIDLAAFRLHALTTLTSAQSARAGASGSAGASDFLNTLMQAQLRQSGIGVNPTKSGTTALDALSQPLNQPLSQHLGRAYSLLDQLEASNAAFLQRYSARVTEIGDEAGVLTRMRERMVELGAASTTLANLAANHSDAELKAEFKGFLARYNAWDSEFDPYFERGGLLQDNQAGDVARFSLKREIGSIFHGAGRGGFALGLTDMGVSFTPDGQVRLDEARFDRALAEHREGAVGTLQNVAKAFGEAANILTSDGHLLDGRIHNALRAVRWAADNQAAVDAEFGPGAATGQLNGRVL